MLTIIQNKSANGLQDYFQRNLIVDDYFFSGQSIKGRWYGKLKDELGLPDQVSKKAFSRLAHNKHPITGKQLTVRHSSIRRVSLEFTYSAPKSVSIILGITGDRQILNAHRKAVKKAMEAVENDVQVQTRVEGKNTYRDTKNLIYSRFDHFTARPTKEEIDGEEKYVSMMQLHSHAVCFNVTKYQNRYQAIETSTVQRVAPYYEAIYRSELAKRLQDVGYDITRTKDAFEIKSIKRSTIEKFSSRTQEILAHAKKLGITSKKRISKLGAKIRLNKSKVKEDANLIQMWKKRCTPLELNIIMSAKGKPKENELTKTPEYTVQQALDKHLERRSILPVKRILATALANGYGKYTLKDVKAALAKRKDMIYAKKSFLNYCTTREVYNNEIEMLDYAVASKGRGKPIHKGFTPTVGFLNKGQKKALNHVLTSHDNVVLLSGGAGTGKTTLLNEIRIAAEQKGKNIHAFAPSASASRDVLRSKQFKKADTIAMLINSKKMQNGIKRDDILLVDEAGLLGVKTTNSIFKIAKSKGAKVLLSGDPMQHSSVERGDAMRQMITLSKMPVGRVKEIVRQKSPAYKAAVKDLADGKTAKGFKKLDEMGAIIEIEDKQKRHEQLADDYIKSLKAKRSALIISPTHKEGMSITEAVRSKLKSDDRIQGKERSFKILKSLNLTEADKQDSAKFELGDYIQPHKNIGSGIVTGKRFKVSRKGHKGEIFVILPDTGKEVQLPLSKHARFQVYKADKINLAKGDKIRLTQNGKTLENTRINNGQGYTVTGFTKNGDIKLSNGKTLDKRHGHLSYGFCTTSHKSQGMDARDIYIAQSSTSFPASSQKQFYVSVSRGCETVRIYTDAKDELFEAVKRSGDRMSAKELKQKSDAQKELKRKQQRYYLQNINQNTYGLTRSKSKRHVPKRTPAVRSLQYDWRETKGRGIDRT